MMEWGCKIADEMGFEAFVESSNDGRKLYEAYGFVMVRPFFLDPQLPSGEPDVNEWLRIKNEISPDPRRVWLMWRPKGGIFEEGKTRFSWEKD